MLARRLHLLEFRITARIFVEEIFIPSRLQFPSVSTLSVYVEKIRTRAKVYFNR